MQQNCSQNCRNGGFSFYCSVIKFRNVFARPFTAKKMSKDLTNLNIQIETSLNQLHQRETRDAYLSKKGEHMDV